MKLHFLFLLVLFSGRLFAQESVLCNSFKFQDGVYFSYLDFVTNTPSMSLRDISFDLLDDPRPLQKYLYNIRIVSQLDLDFDTCVFWGICIDGQPYVNQSTFIPDPHDARVKQTLLSFFNKSYVGTYLIKKYLDEYAFVFTRIMEIGAVCHFTADGDRLIPVLLDDPKFSNVSRKRVFKQMLLESSSGHIVDFTPENIQMIICDDPVLFNQYRQLSKKKQKQQAVRIIKEYNEKHPMQVNTTEPVLRVPIKKTPELFFE